MRPYIASEIAPLREVIVHRPEYALQRFNPENCHNFLFDDVVWLEKAQEDHAKLVSILRENDVIVHYFSELLCEVLSNEEGRNWLLKNIVNEFNYGPLLAPELLGYLSELNSKELAKKLTDGIVRRELDFKPAGLTGSSLSKDEFVILPLPNLLFQRDVITIMFDKISINSMAHPIRKNETICAAAIFFFHKLFKEGNLTKIYEGYSRCMPPIEGGDILVISPTCILIGLGQRTTAQAIEILAMNIFEHSRQKENIKIIVIKLPKTRSTMHLDTVLTMINHDTFSTFSPIINEKTKCWMLSFESKHSTIKVKKQNNLFTAIESALNCKKINLIHSLIHDENISLNEQWNDSVNLLTLSPGAVLSYDRNVRANDRLRSEGIKVITVPGSELGRGRGGMHCMVAPLKRNHHMEKI